MTLGFGSFIETAVPISSLPPAGTITGAELIPVVQDGQTRKATAAAIAAGPSVGSYPFVTWGASPLGGALQLSGSPDINIVTGGGTIYSVLNPVITAGTTVANGISVPVITYDAKGRITAVSSTPILVSGGGGGGSVISVSGTTNRISVVNPTTTPVVDIDAAYVGQASITTLGTISTGTWQGGVISSTYGGTGVNNAGRTITLGGNFATSGAFATTLTVTGATNVTLPTTGTLATQAGAETLTNKTISGASNTLSNITTTSLTGTLQAAQFPALTGDITTSAGSLTTAIAAGVIINADVNASAAIAVTKLAALTASRAVVTNASGFISTATTTSTEIGYVNGVTSAIQTQLNSKASTTQTTEYISVFVETASNKDYKLVVNIPHGGTITSVTTISTSGTCTLTGKINTTALGGTANSVSTTETTQNHASANTFVTGDDIVITVSSNSSCVNMTVTIKYTRTLS